MHFNPRAAEEVFAEVRRWLSAQTARVTVAVLRLFSTGKRPWADAAAVAASSSAGAVRSAAAGRGSQTSWAVRRLSSEVFRRAWVLDIVH